MKELKMFPQITEETEENLLNLEQEPKSPYASTPPLNSSSSSSESPTEAPASPSYENQVPCQLPTITTEVVEPSTNTPNGNHQNSTPDEEFATPPPRTRMRSLSGGAYRLAPTLPAATGRMRRQSGDDVLTRVSPSRRAALIEHFRPRSKSDSKGKRPTFLTSLKNSFFSGGGVQRKTSLEAESPPPEPLHPTGDYRQRSRSGSDTRGGTMSKVIDLFRSRSHSLSIDSKIKKQLNSSVPAHAFLRRQSLDPDKKRRPVSSYRSLDVHQGETYSCHTDDYPPENIIDYAALDDDKIIPTFLNSCSCYDAMPKSGKVILLSTDLLIKNAFSSLVTNEIRAAPLWDSTTHSFVGMLTITDFINILRHYYSTSCEDIKDIENQKISTWRGIVKVKKPFIKIAPNASLSQATKLLLVEGVHRLPVYDEKKNSVLFVLTRKRLLKYLNDNMIEKFGTINARSPEFLKKSIGELKIGTYENIAKISLKSKVIEALDLFVERSVSSLPVLDEDEKLVDVFSKFDVFALAKEQTYHNLDMPISEALDKTAVHEGVYGCTFDEPLGSVINKFVTAKVHRLVVIDERSSLIGMVSLSDILKFLVLKSLDSLEEPGLLSEDTIDETPEAAIGGTEMDSSVFLPSEEESSSSSQAVAKTSKEDCSNVLEDFNKIQVNENAPEPLTESSVCESEPKTVSTEE